MHLIARRLSHPAVLVPLATLALAPGRGWSAEDEWCREHGWDSRARVCEVRESTFAPGAALAVDARPNGGIELRSTDARQVRLLAKVEATAETDADARALVEQVRVETGETIRARGPASVGRKRSYWVSYRLEVPTDVRVTLEADNGGISVRDFSGVAELHTVNGGLHIARAAGDVHGETVNGGLHVDLEGTQWTGQGLRLRTTNGGLHLTVPRDYNARLEVGTVNGGVHSDIPATSKKRWSGGRIDTELGRGGAPVQIETTNGGLHVARR